MIENRMSAVAKNQLDLFMGASLKDTPSFRDDLDLMALPFFSIQKTPRYDPIEHEWEVKDRRFYIRITAGEDGIATIWDNDILIYLRTLLVDALNRGQPVSNRIQFVIGDCLKTIGRHTGKYDYELFMAALRRLSSTRIATNLSTAEVIEDHSFGWIQEFKVKRRRNGQGFDVMSACEVVLSDWLFNAILIGNRALAIDPIYLKLTGGLERKLFLIARRHVGHQGIPFRISLSKLYDRVGAQMPLRRFKFELSKMIEAGTFPTYDIQMISEVVPYGSTIRRKGEVMVVFSLKGRTLPGRS